MGNGTDTAVPSYAPTLALPTASAKQNILDRNSWTYIIHVWDVYALIFSILLVFFEVFRRRVGYVYDSRKVGSRALTAASWESAHRARHDARRPFRVAAVSCRGRLVSRPSRVAASREQREREEEREAAYCFLSRVAAVSRRGRKEA